MYIFRRSIENKLFEKYNSSMYNNVISEMSMRYVNRLRALYFQLEIIFLKFFEIFEH